MMDYTPAAQSSDTDALENNANGDDVTVKTSAVTVPDGPRYLVFSFIRHAECVSNVRLHYAELDPLTERGLEQAEILGEQWADVRIDQLWASNLERAYTTADILSQHNKGHPKTTRFDCIQERLDRAAATRDGNYAVKLALTNHGVNLREDPLRGWEEYPGTSLPDGIPHVVFVSHGGFLSHLCESLYSEEDDHWRKWNYDNTDWTRHLVWHDAETDKLRIKLLCGKGVDYYSSPFGSSPSTSDLNPVQRGHSGCQGNGRSIDISAAVVKIIIDHLHDCKPALQSCALVSRAWLRASRSHLFHSIHLHPHMARGTEFSYCMRSPHILVLIRNLRIIEGKYEWSNDWVNHMPSLVLLLNSLTRLNTLHLERFDWSRLKPELRGALRHVFASNPLSNLKFEECKFPFTSLLSIFNMCSGSISLTLSHVDLFPPGMPSEAVALVVEEEAGYMGLENKCRFRAIRTVECPPEILSWLSGDSGPDLSQLHALYCDCDGSPSTLLHRLGGHLRHLSLRAPCNQSADERNDLLLGNLTGLRSLEVTHISSREPTYFVEYSGPSWLQQLLQSIPITTDLQHIKLKVLSDAYSIPYDTCVAIEDTLDGDVFPALMRVEVNLESSRYRDDPSEDKLKGLFPRLEKRRVLDIRTYWRSIHL